MSISEIKKDTPELEKDITLYLSDFWRGFLKFWWVGVLLGIVLGGISFYRSYIQYVPVYRTTATYTVYMENDILSGDGGMSAYSFFYDRTTADQLAIVFPYVLQSNILQERVCRDLEVPVMPAQVNVNCVAGTNMLTFTTTGSDPQATYDVLQSVIDNYAYVTEYIIGPTKLNMISSAEVPEQPINALAWQKQTLKSVLTGLLIGAVWIVLYAVLRQTVRTKEDMQRELNQTCLGVLPQVTFKRYKRKIDTNVLLNNTMLGNEFVESVRLLSAAVQSGLQENEKVILVSSTAPGEGKSVATLNLAAMLAKTNARVLVIDGDLRNSGIARMLGNVTPQIGEGHYDIFRAEQLGVDLLTFRTGQKRLWRIMRTGNLNQIMADLRQRYDLILIDTPPCGIISDAAIMANVADTALYVVRQDTVLSSRIRKGISTLLATDVRFMGCILNGALGGLGGYGNHYGYGGYSHYYRYGYYGRGKSGKKS